jgi:hypothetical protein
VASVELPEETLAALRACFGGGVVEEGGSE